MIFDILEAKIVAAGLAAPGVSLFRNSMPAECQVGVLLRMPLQGIEVDPYIEGWYTPKLQVIVRHKDPVAGQILSDLVIKTLLVESPQPFAATAEHSAGHIALFYPSQLPIQFPMLEGNGIEWSLNFSVAFGIVPSWK